MQQGASSKVGGQHQVTDMIISFFPGGPCVAPLGAVHHPLLPPPHCYQLISQLLYLLPQALQRSHLQRVSAPSMAETCQGDRDILLTGSTQFYSVILQDGLILQNGDTVITRIHSKKVS